MNLIAYLAGLGMGIGIGVFLGKVIEIRRRIRRWSTPLEITPQALKGATIIPETPYDSRATYIDRG